MLIRSNFLSLILFYLMVKCFALFRHTKNLSSCILSLLGQVGSYENKVKSGEEAARETEEQLFKPPVSQERSGKVAQEDCR